MLCIKNNIQEQWMRVSLRFGAGGHLDLAPRQSLCKALKIFKVYSRRDAKGSQAKLSSQPANLPGVQPFMKPLSHIQYLNCFSIHFWNWRLHFFSLAPQIKILRKLPLWKYLKVQISSSPLWGICLKNRSFCNSKTIYFDRKASTSDLLLFNWKNLLIDV